MPGSMYPNKGMEKGGCFVLPIITIIAALLGHEGAGALLSIFIVIGILGFIFFLKDVVFKKKK